MHYNRMNYREILESCWPLLMGWTVVVLLLLNDWKRQAAIAAAGMAIVTFAVLSAGLGGS